MPEIVRHQHRVGYWAKGKEKHQFVPLTNFGLKLLKHVEAPSSLREESGFVVEVTQKLKGTARIRSGYGITCSRLGKSWHTMHYFFA